MVQPTFAADCLLALSPCCLQFAQSTQGMDRGNLGPGKRHKVGMIGRARSAMVPPSRIDGCVLGGCGGFCEGVVDEVSLTGGRDSSCVRVVLSLALLAPRRQAWPG